MQYILPQKLKDMKKIVSDIEFLLEHVKDKKLSDEIQKSIIFAMREINNQLYMSYKLDFDCFDGLDEKNVDEICSIVEFMLPIWKCSLDRRSGLKTDSEFWAIYEYFKYVNRDTIISNTLKVFSSYPEDYKKEFTTLPLRYTFLTGKIDVEKDDYSLIPIYVDMMKNEIDNFKWLYERLGDYRSKSILIRIVRFWFELNLYDLSDLHENVFCDYFDTDLLLCEEDEVLVDCGAYIGDSILQYIQTYGEKYRTIYGYEINPDTMEKMKNNLKEFERINFKRKGVGKRNEVMYLDDNMHDAGAKVSDTGTNVVEVVSLDDDIDEPITVIKMDIEGAEQDAINGAKRHIVEEKPRLLVCTYHKPEDLFQIPKLIDSIRDDYKFYLRFNGRGIWPCDHVLFAI